MPAAIDLCLIADLKTYLGKDGQPISGSDDTMLAALITSASKFLINEMNRDTLLSASRVLTFSGRGSGHRKFVFRVIPVISVQSVVVGAVTIPQATNPLTDAGWYLVKDAYDVQFLALRNYEFTRGDENCQVTCTTGYTTVPEDIAECAKELCALRYRERKRIGVVMEAQASGSTVTYTQADLTPFMRTIIQNYTLRF
jgi:hypothetical protein